jgi:hypothetical protein
MTCTATFTLNQYTLTVNQDGKGSGMVGGGGTFAYGTTVTPTASPAAGSTFAGWTPPSCGSPFTLTADTTCTATFNLNPPLCATDVGSTVNVVRGGFRFNRTTGRFGQIVTLRNTGTAPLQGPVSLVLDNLSSNATLYTKTGVTTCAAPTGSPYQDVNVGADQVLSPGESATAALEFINPSNQGITYGTRVLAGAGTR